MFLLMSTFFLYPANFALETSGDGVIGQQYIAAIMAGADLVALFGGLLFVRIQGVLRGGTKVFAPLLFLVGYLLLTFLGAGPAPCWGLPASALPTAPASPS